MPTITTSSDAQGDLITLVTDPANGAPEAEIVSHADGSRMDYAWLGVAADATLQVTGGTLTVAGSDTLGQTYRMWQTIFGATRPASIYWSGWLATTGDETGLGNVFLAYTPGLAQSSALTFVADLYANGLDRPVDPYGFSLFTNYLASGGTEAGAAVGISQSQEAINDTTGAFVDFLYNDNPSGFAFSARAFDIYGRLTQDGFNYLDGDSQSDGYDIYGRVTWTDYQQAYGNLNVISHDYSGTLWWSRYESDYSASGQLLDNTANVTGGGSLIQTYSQSAGDTWWQKIDWFDGASGQGAWTQELIDYRDGSSSIIDTNPYHTENNAYKIDQYTGPSGTGTLKIEVSVQSDGSYSVAQFANPADPNDPVIAGETNVNTSFDSKGDVISVSTGFVGGASFTMDFLKDEFSYDDGAGNVASQFNASLADYQLALAGTSTAVLASSVFSITPLSVFLGIMNPTPLNQNEPDILKGIQAFKDGFAAGVASTQNLSSQMGFGPGGLGTGTYGSPEPPEQPASPSNPAGLY